MKLPAAIGDYPHTQALRADPALDLQPFPVITRAFAPMVRDQAFALSEIAIATFLQARAHGSSLVLLPVVLSARFQTGAMLRRADAPFGPEGLRGRRIGVRAYSQTTGMWLRGILEEETGIPPQDIHWTTFEDAHVAAFHDPPWADRAPPGSDMLAMLLDGQLDAAVFGNDMPATPALAPVWPDPDAAAASFRQRHGFVPINHMLAIRPDAAATPGLAPRLAALVPPAPHRPNTRAALDPAIALAIRYSTAQGLIPRPLTLEEVWAAPPRECPPHE